ncbi:MAG: hypothetical protein KGH87_09505 [Thaumarchaeota archaeon]|nr:hypothetical protein [Nitrososphaerota archaeon]
MNLGNANEWLQSAYWWLEMAKYDLSEKRRKECKKTLKIVETRIKWVEGWLKND